MAQTMTYTEWMEAADAATWAKGLSIHDLPDQPYGDWYEDGMSPKAAARKAYRAAGGPE